LIKIEAEEGELKGFVSILLTEDATWLYEGRHLLDDLASNETTMYRISVHSNEAI